MANRIIFRLNLINWIAVVKFFGLEKYVRLCACFVLISFCLWRGGNDVYRWQVNRFQWRVGGKWNMAQPLRWTILQNGRWVSGDKKPIKLAINRSTHSRTIKDVAIVVGGRNCISSAAPIHCFVDNSHNRLLWFADKRFKYDCSRQNVNKTK